MEASNGERQGRAGQSQDFSSSKWRRASIKKLNICTLSHKFVDDLGGKRPNLSGRELPFSILKGDQFNELMELGFPGYLAGSDDIKDAVDAIRDRALPCVSEPGDSESSSD
jgi:hypothetical protein